MLILKRVAPVKGVCTWIPECAPFLVSNFSISLCSRCPKKHSSVDSDRYSSLVKSVMSFRVSSQTPDTLKAEDEHMFGPVVKALPLSKEDVRVPKSPHPFLQREETKGTDENHSGPPVRILLNRKKGSLSIPSVTRILQHTLSPEQTFFLERWKKRMVSELGEEGFKEYTQNLFRQGKQFHSALEDFLMSDTAWKDKESETPAQGYLKSVSHILEDVSSPRAIESAVHHSSLNYVGVVDCVAHYRGVLCIIDWKTSDKPKPYLSNTYDNPIQVAAYAGALNSDGNYNYQVENGLIVVAYKDGAPAHAHQLSAELMLEYWNKWLLRLEEFTSQRATTVNQPPPSNQGVLVNPGLN